MSLTLKFILYLLSLLCLLLLLCITSLLQLLLFLNRHQLLLPLLLMQYSILYPVFFRSLPVVHDDPQEFAMLKMALYNLLIISLSEP